MPTIIYANLVAILPTRGILVRIKSVEQGAMEKGYRAWINVQIGCMVQSNLLGNGYKIHGVNEVRECDGRGPLASWLLQRFAKRALVLVSQCGHQK